MPCTVCKNSKKNRCKCCPVRKQGNMLLSGLLAQLSRLEFSLLQDYSWPLGPSFADVLLVNQGKACLHLFGYRQLGQTTLLLVLTGVFLTYLRQLQRCSPSTRLLLLAWYASICTVVICLAVGQQGARAVHFCHTYLLCDISCVLSHDLCLLA